LAWAVESFGVGCVIIGKMVVPIFGGEICIYFQIDEMYYLSLYP
jgi:hypothetical protein